MGHPRPEAVDELVEHELAVQQVLVVRADLGGQAIEKLGLHLAQRLGGHTATAGQVRIGLFPLAQLVGPLLLGAALSWLTNSSSSSFWRSWAERISRSSRVCSISADEPAGRVVACSCVTSIWLKRGGRDRVRLVTHGHPFLSLSLV